MTDKQAANSRKAQEGHKDGCGNQLLYKPSSVKKLARLPLPIHSERPASQATDNADINSDFLIRGLSRYFPAKPSVSRKNRPGFGAQYRDY